MFRIVPHDIRPMKINNSVLLIVGAGLALVTGCRESFDSIPGNISRREASFEWPLTVDAGRLRCEAQAVTFEAHGTVYAVNGTAMTRRLGKDIDEIWAAADPIWITDPKTKEKVNVGPPKRNIGPLIDAGLEFCSN